MMRFLQYLVTTLCMWYIAFTGVTSTLICSECPSVHLQRAPGIGIDLTVAYGTAAINFHNGTIRNVAKIDGSPQYIAAMKALVADSELVSRNESSKLPGLEFSTTSRPISLFPLGIPFLYPRPQISSDRQVIAIKSLLVELKTAINATARLSYPYIYVSYPDTIAQVNTHRGRFDTAAEEAGFDIVGARGSSRSILYDHRMHRCCIVEDEDESCVGEPCATEVKVLLAVSLTEKSLETAVLTRTIDSWAMPGRIKTAINVGLGLSSSKYIDNKSYWSKVRDAVKNSIGKDMVDRVMFLGEHWENKELRDTVHEVLAEKASDGSLDTAPFEDKILNTSSGLWSAARGSAVAAKGLLLDHLDGCVPDDSCEKVEYRDEL
ncbi:hypothetical protein ONS95_003370 [Cadophora gregata]|uniref:uncharacterized protein n=1 Tax=Cadophora gregata TaxID=51156 RepID=UPI0026DAA653|nr:uncharacterized protein ONS95_003370 [Cadophora gregata]KAK0108572.1 hypothetical protein ONS95_003370 [Cadophora gregata]KAK0108834.1 hypothetical protein ONS96_014930 [Cadophora gregata f. sp. sojae]